MSEYIITGEQLKTATEAYLKHELSRPITEVFVSGDKLPEIVRCRDCRYARKTDAGMDCGRHILCARFKPDGFCAWGSSTRGMR